MVSTTVDEPWIVSAADLDDDSDVDLLISLGPDYSAILWFENGGGLAPSFTERVLAATVTTGALFTADVNDDGAVDVLSASWQDAEVAWLENDKGSPPTFTKRVISATDIAVPVFGSDLDGDNDIDLVTASILDGLVLWYEHSPPPCGPCQLLGDVFPFDAAGPEESPVGNCVVDIDDVLMVLGAFSAPDQCWPHFPEAVNSFPCGQVCAEGVVDVDDILSTLAAFAGSYSCPHPCPPGGCCLQGGACQDGDGAGAGTTPPGGMSHATCLAVAGTYQGDGTNCDDITCP
jgi:hypothetical protein